MKEIGPRRILVIATRQELRQEDARISRDIENRIHGTPLKTLEAEIAEHLFRRPFHVVGSIAIRPFWRDRKKVPALPMSEPSSYPRSHHF